MKDKAIKLLEDLKPLIAARMPDEEQTLDWIRSVVDTQLDGGGFKGFRGVNRPEPHFIVAPKPEEWR